MVIGTMPYMSPEQVEGKTLDHRTDLFSLGVIFHEMLTGSRPFTGDSSAQIMSSILRDTPPRMSELRADVPEELSRLIHHCLEKRVGDRVQTAKDVYSELKQLQRQLESGVTRRSDARVTDSSAGLNSETFVVTVLPFTAGGHGGDASDLADGLTQDLTVGLSRFTYLRVVQREASLDSVKTGFVLHGSVRVSGAVVRVVAQLDRCGNGSTSLG
jgi:serine/threonine-protein kinase